MKKIFSIGVALLLTSGTCGFLQAQTSLNAGSGKATGANGTATFTKGTGRFILSKKILLY